MGDKLKTQWLGKCNAFGKQTSKSKGQKDVSFELYHYAGTVGYNVESWLEKNKDPLNASVVELYKKSSLPLMVEIWGDYKTIEEVLAAEKEAAAKGGKKKKKKGASFITVSFLHRESLGRLMTNLHATHPHFVRCIVPNEHKNPGEVDPHLILHQLRCNGVLEGIRICRKGYPNRMYYPDFKQRYKILNPGAIPEPEYFDNKKASEKLLTSCGLDEDQFKFGLTKEFFRAGFLGTLEEVRDARLSSIFIGAQACIRVKLAKQLFVKRLQWREAARTIQSNIRSYLFVKDWKWMQIMYLIKPLVAPAEAAKEMEEVVEELESAKASLEKETKRRKELEEQNLQLMSEKNKMALELASAQDQLEDAEERIEQLLAQMEGGAEKQAEMAARLEELEAMSEDLLEKKRGLETELETLNAAHEELQGNYKTLQKEKEEADKKMSEDIASYEEMTAKLQKDKKQLKEGYEQAMEDLQKEEDKVNHLTKAKSKLEKQEAAFEKELEEEK